MEVDFLSKSREYIEKGSFEKAQIALRRVLSKDPKNARAVELSGDLVLKLGRNGEAIQRYESASDYYSNKNQYAEAILCLEKIIRLDESNGEIAIRLADLYRFYGLLDRAINTILNLCTWAINNKQDAQFVSGLRKVVELQPKNLALRFCFIKVLYAISRLQDAEDELKKLKSLAEEAGDKEILEEVSKLLPQTDGGEELDPKSRIELGNLLYEIGSKDEAIVEFEKAVSDLIDTNDTEEAISVLNRIVEIDPNNTDAINKINELKGSGVPVESETAGEETESTVVVETPAETAEQVVPESEVEEQIPTESGEGETEETFPRSEKDEASKPSVEDIIDQTVSEANVEKETDQPETSEQTPGDDQAMEMFEDLGKEIEGFVAATDTPAEGPSEKVESGGEETHGGTQLEGQIADIEFLLNQAEAPSVPDFELAQEFDAFRKAIVWKEADIDKKLSLAKMAFDSGLYATALSYIVDIKGQKKTWPLSLEINGGSLIKLGRYSEARKVIAPALLYEEISETQKMELRYLLATAYEGLGDFDNALRETERIISIDPHYKDVKEMYILMGGKNIVYDEPKKEPEKFKPTHEMPVSMPAPLPEPFVQPTEMGPTETIEEPTKETYPTIIEETPSTYSEKPSEKTIKKEPDVEERKGENIAFL
jgi:tetratricopeptide (TPR) repeat protein